MKIKHSNKPQKYWYQQVQFVACLMVSIFLLSLPGCKKDKIDKTPSQSGANTLYFEAEGKEWRAIGHEYMSVFNATVVYLNDSLFHLIVDAESDQKKISTSIEIYLFNIKDIGRYGCNENVKYLSYYKGNLDSPSEDKFCTSCLVRDESILITRLDTTAKIISGTFSFVAQCQDSSLIEIKNGWFDYHYPYYQ